MAIEHWTTAYLTGANASFQRAAREYAEEYAAMAVAEERERWIQPATMAVQELAHCATWSSAGIACQLLRDVVRPDTSAPLT